MPNANLLLLIAVLLPPSALDLLGEVLDERTYLTPYGAAGPLALRRVGDDLAVWVQPYTGLPTRTDPRATLFAARQLGVQRILNWDMGIAINPVLQRGQPVVVADYIGWTSHQPDTFFSDAHTGLEINYGSVRAPFCPEMGAAIQQLLPGLPEAVAVGVDFLRRETRAEARMFRQWGADVLTYNLAPEVALAQELGLCYAGLVTVSGYAADRAQPEPMGEVRASLSTTLQMLPAFVEMVAQARQCACGE
jgi:5'-methylthioadenosine phosphorylase